MLFPVLSVSGATPLMLDLGRISGPGVRVSSITIHNDEGSDQVYYGLLDWAPGTRVGGVFAESMLGKKTVAYGKVQGNNFSASANPVLSTSGIGLQSVQPGWVFSDFSSGGDDGNVVLSNVDGVITFANVFGSGHNGVETAGIEQPVLSSGNGIPVVAGSTVMLEAGYLDYKLSRWFGLVVAGGETATVRLQITVA